MLERQFDTWVECELDVATVRDDHYPAVLEILWQPVAHCELAQWHTPIMDRAALKAGEAARAFQDTLSQLVVPDLATPVDAFHEYVLRTFQVQGSLCFPIPESVPRKEWLSDIMYGVLHPSAQFVVLALSFTAEALCRSAK